MQYLTFTIAELLSLIGLAQCVYVLVYMMFRSGDPKRAAIPFLYFFLLATAFFLDFSAGYIGNITDYYNIIQWAVWFYGPPLSVLLMIQVAQISQLPSFASYWVLLLIPAGFAMSYVLAGSSWACEGQNTFLCPTFIDWLQLMGLLSGIISLLAIWSLRHILHNLYEQKEGRARYWLVLTLIMVNLMFLSAMFLEMTPYVTFDQAQMIRTIFGICFVYLAGTSLFRIYPQALVMLSRAEKQALMSEDEQDLAGRVESLLEREKIYHEPAYSRTDLARELNVSEAVLSRVINLHFGKSFPQLLNEKRVEDAKSMLLETKASIKTIAQEAGFNSLASFNRVFKDVSGLSPSEFRESPPEESKRGIPSSS